jgi:hypothetical protein
MLRKWLKIWLILMLSGSLFLLVLFWLISSNDMMPKSHINSADVTTSHTILSQTLAKLRSNSGRIELMFEQPQLDALLNVASYALPAARFNGVISPYGVAISVQTPLLSTGRSVKAACLLLNEGRQFAIINCRLGKLPLPGPLANWILKQAVKKTVSAPENQQLLRLFASGQLINNQLVFIDENASPIELNLRNLPYTPAALLQKPLVLAPDVMFYLEKLKQLQYQYPGEHRLAFFALELLNTAQQHQSNDITNNQYHNATWALIVAFGNRRFIHYANSKVPATQVPSFRPALLNDRHDLTLHFLYSAAIKLISSAQLSQQIGNLKEIMDAAEGGSGFSFVDLAADYAGIYFAENINDINLEKIKTLSVAEFEAAFMPDIVGLPEGLSEQQMQHQFGGYQGQQFKQTEKIILNRLQQLCLYK